MHLNAKWSPLYVAFLLLFISKPLYAQLSTVSTAFTGSAIETFEEFNPADVYGSSVPIPIFSGLATMSGPAEYIWVNGSILDPYTFALGNNGGGNITAKSSDGNQGFGMSVPNGTNVINFSTPVVEFGGYWASAVDNSFTPATKFHFYDASGASIGGG